MNSYINLILDAKGARERLERLFQSAPELEKNDQSLPPAAARKQRQRRRRSARSRTPYPSEGIGHSAVRVSFTARLGSASIEATIWIASYVLAILGLINAAYSEQPLLWLAIWPAPIVLASVIFIFFRRGFHYRDGLLVLGRSGSENDESNSRQTGTVALDEFRKEGSNLGLLT
jgi:hypothetical protein